MLIIGCDFHTRYQQIAMAREETAELLVQRRLDHESGEAHAFYRELQSSKEPVRVGIEATGPMHWFERLLGELGHELWIGDSAKIRASEVRKQKTDERDARLILDLLLAKAGGTALNLGAGCFWVFLEVEFGCRTLVFFKGAAFDFVFRATGRSVQHVDAYHSLFALRVMAPTAPRPILGMLHKFPLHRIPMHIIQFFLQFFATPHIEVVEPPLPECLCVFLPLNKGQRQLPLRPSRRLRKARETFCFKTCKDFEGSPRRASLISRCTCSGITTNPTSRNPWRTRTSSSILTNTSRACRVPRKGRRR